MILTVFFSVGLVLLALPLIRYASDELDRKEVVGWLLLATGVFTCLWMIGSVLVG